MVFQLKIQVVKFVTADILMTFKENDTQHIFIPGEQELYHFMIIIK